MKVVPRTPGPTSETFNGSGYFLHSLKSQLPSHINRSRTEPNQRKPTLGSAVGSIRAILSTHISIDPGVERLSPKSR